MNFNVVSFNVGGARDWVNLAVRAELQKEGEIIGPELNLEDNANKKANFFRQIDQKSRNLNHDQIIAEHNEKVGVKLKNLIDKFNPDAFCLQEYFPKPTEDNKALRQVLKERGYALIEKQDLAIAYKIADFAPIGSERYTVDRNASTTEPALYVDLRHIRTGVVARVVTDHVQGFNGVAQKLDAYRRKALGVKGIVLPNNHKARMALLQRQAADPKGVGAAAGDLSLEKNLEVVEKESIFYQRKRGFLGTCIAMIKNLFRKTKPDFIVYGLDANTTVKSVSDNKQLRLHPKRMRLFEKRNFRHDVSDNRGTIIDANSYRKLKFDYVLAKGGYRSSIAVHNENIREVNDESLLDNPGEIISDHLPVLTNIRYRKARLISRFIAKIFGW